MTVATTFSRELDVTTLIKRAYQLAGLMPPEAGATGPTWAPRASLAKDLLQTILDELQTEGVFARSASRIDLTLTAGTTEYFLPDNVWDVEGNGAYIAAGEDVDAASSETPVLQRDQETWQMMSAKSAEGTPILFWVDRTTSPVKVVLWPIPDEAGTIRFISTRLLADVTQGNSTLDLERFWAQYLLWQLAHQLAISANKLEHGAYLAGLAAQKMQRAKAAANTHVASQIQLDHYTAWTR